MNETALSNALLDLPVAAHRDFIDLASRGYEPVTENFPYGLIPGAKVRHHGERWYEAINEGTGRLVAVLVKNTNPQDIEVLVKPFDETKSVRQWANYHTVVIEDGL